MSTNKKDSVPLIIDIDSLFVTIVDFPEKKEGSEAIVTRVKTLHESLIRTKGSRSYNMPLFSRMLTDAGVSYCDTTSKVISISDEVVLLIINTINKRTQEAWDRSETDRVSPLQIGIHEVYGSTIYRDKTFVALSEFEKYKRELQEVIDSLPAHLSWAEQYVYLAREWNSHNPDYPMPKGTTGRCSVFHVYQNIKYQNPGRAKGTLESILGIKFREPGSMEEISISGEPPQINQTSLPEEIIEPEATPITTEGTIENTLIVEPMSPEEQRKREFFRYFDDNQSTLTAGVIILEEDIYLDKKGNLGFTQGFHKRIAKLSEIKKEAILDIIGAFNSRKRQ